MSSYLKSQVKPTKEVPKRRKKSTASSNLYVSPSLIDKFQKYVGREQKSDSLKVSSNNGNKESKEIKEKELKESKESKESKETEKKKASKDVRLMSNLPNDTAVHFGSFYGVEGNMNKPRTTKAKNSMDSINLSYKSIPRLEFTRQMVQK